FDVPFEGGFQPGDHGGGAADVQTGARADGLITTGAQPVAGECQAAVPETESGDQQHALPVTDRFAPVPDRVAEKPGMSCSLVRHFLTPTSTVVGADAVIRLGYPLACVSCVGEA